MRQPKGDLRCCIVEDRAIFIDVARNRYFALAPELNRAFVNNDERLDPAMAALAHVLGVTNVELRASEKSAARGIYLTGLFPLPDYAPEGGYKIDNSLVLAFARIESRFQTQATSPVGARGLMQVMPATARRFGVTSPKAQLHDPKISLEVSSAYLKTLQQRFDNNLTLVIAAYNAGEGAVEKYGRQVPPYKETQGYVRDVMAHYRALLSLRDAGATPAPARPMRFTPC